MRQQGFTLLELLVVLGIAALVVTVVGVRADAWMERSAYHQAVRDVATLLRAGKTAAWQEGRDVAVRLDAGGRVLSLGDDARAQVTLPADLDVQAERVVAATVGRAGDAVMGPLFVFRADGSAYGGRLALLRGQAGVAFQVNWALGSVEQVSVAAPPS
ncbi:MAG: prepilin-type N-terminal cleavage/methylation domain-containing protein [Tepidimonas fonticaldi]|nr:prepilin-type N-terminal cleavage/methylation domain-containing protein [Tepidimonas fonticaldi]